MRVAKSFVLFPVLAFCLMATMAKADPWVQWSSSSGGNGHYYTVVSTPGGINWYDAKNAAEAMGGYLATIHSEEENDFIFNLINKSEYWVLDGAGNFEGPWLGGLRNPNNYGEWIWETGEAWTYSKWAAYQPDNSGGSENRLIYFGWGENIDKGWNDIGGGYGAHGYVVESTVPEPATMSLLALGGLAMIRRRIYKGF